MSHPASAVGGAPTEVHGAGPSVGAAPQNPAHSQQGGGAWEGDSTLHSYCYDYMRKRGWNSTASAFAADAGIDEQQWTGPPIEAPQGWWSVFWDVFIARNQKTGQRNLMAESYVEAMRHKHSPLMVSFPANTNAPPLALPRSLGHPARQQGPLGPTLAPGGPRTNPMAAQNHVLEQQQIQRDMQQRAAQAAQQAQAGGMRPPGPPQQPQPYGPGTSSSPAPGGIHPAQQHMMGGPGGPGGQMSHPGQHSQQGLQYQQQQNYPNQPLSLHGSPHLQHAVPPGQFNPNGPPQQRGPGQLGPGQQLPGQDGRGPLASVFQQCAVAVGLGERHSSELNADELSAIAAQMRRVGALPPLQGQPGPTGPPGQPQPMGIIQPGQPMAQVGVQGGMRGQQQPAVRVASGQGQRFDQQGQPIHAPQRMMSGGPGGQQQPGGPMTPQQQQYAQQQQQQQQQQLIQQHQVRMGQQAQQQRPPGAHEHLQQQMAYSPASPNHHPTPTAGAPAQSPYASTPFNPAAPSPAQNGAVASPGSFNQPLPPPAAPAGRGAGGKRGAAGGTKMSPAPSKGRGAAGAQAQTQTGDDPSPRSRKRARAATKDEDSIVANGMPTPNDVAGAAGQFEGASPSMSVNGAHTPMGPPGGPPYKPSPSPAQFQNGVEGMAHSDPNHPANGGPISRPGSSASNYLNLSGPPGAPFAGQASQDPNARSPQPPTPYGQQPPGGPGQSPQLQISIPQGGAHANNGHYMGSAPQSATVADGPRPFAVSGAPNAQIAPQALSVGGSNSSTQPSPLGANGPQQLDDLTHHLGGPPQQDNVPTEPTTMDPSLFGMGPPGAGAGPDGDDMFADLDLGNLGGVDFDFGSFVHNEYLDDSTLSATS